MVGATGAAHGGRMAQNADQHLSCPPAPPSAPRWSDPRGGQGDPGTPGSDAGGGRAGRDGPDRSRAGAIWVSATGAFLLFAAAAVFVAVQWDHLPDQLKLAVLGGLSAGCLLAGRRLRATLPATGGVLFHLGAFLLPVVSAAAALGVGAGWPAMLVVEGLVGSVAFGLLGRVERSVVLDWAAVAAAVVLAGGIGATTPVPTPVVLVLMAGGALAARRRGAAVAWALVAGLGPVVALAEPILWVGHGVLGQLGLDSASPAGLGLATGLGAAVVLGCEAQRRRDLTLVVLAALAACVGAARAWVGWSPGATAAALAAAAVFALVELVAAATARDPFWSRPARVAAVGAEAVTATVSTGLALALVSAADHGWGDLTWSLDPAWLTAGLLTTAGWLVADLRRRQPDRTPMGIALLVGGGWTPGTVGMALTAIAAVGAGTASPLAVAVTAVAAAALLVLSGRPGGHTLAVLLAVPAPLAGTGHPVVAALVGLAGALTLAAAALVRAPGVHDEITAQEVWLLAMAAVLPVLSATVATVGSVEVTVVALGAVIALWAVGVVLDRGELDERTSGLGLVPRGASLLALVAAPALGHAGLASVSGLLGLFALVDAVSRRRWWMTLATALLAPLAVGSAVAARGATSGQVAMVLVATGLGAAAASLLVDRPWITSWWVAELVCFAAAGYLAANDRGALGWVLVGTGTVLLMAAARWRRTEVATVGAVAATSGIWLELIERDVRTAEPYLAPVALALVAAGVLARHHVRQDDRDDRDDRPAISSWVAYAPAVALLGGAALLERLTGGPPWHALVAGAVAMAAVLCGGARRLIAPLLLGTALLVVLTVNESLAVTAGVPTWAWLALGGTVLVATGVGMERTDHTPLETGRRVVDVVNERFS